MMVSVVMPVYNKAPFLREAFQSILGGTYEELELIAVDDASTDNSLALLRAVDDPRVRIVEGKANRGPAAAAQAGIDAARGRYIVRMDADDIALPERIAVQVAFMEAHPEVGASGGQIAVFGDETGRWQYPLAPEACAAQLVFDSPIAQGASILRRSVLQTHGVAYDPEWPRNGEDRLFWLALAPHTLLANVPEVLLHYRRGAQNIARGRDRVADVLAIQRRAFEAMGIPAAEEDLAHYLLARGIFTERPTSAAVRALRSWYDGLLQLNEELHFAPAEAFRNAVEAQWAALYAYLPRYGLLPALAHLRSSERPAWGKLWYALRYRTNVFLGRLPKG